MNENEGCNLHLGPEHWAGNNQYVHPMAGEGLNLLNDYIWDFEYKRINLHASLPHNRCIHVCQGFIE